VTFGDQVERVARVAIVEDDLALPNRRRWVWLTTRRRLSAVSELKSFHSMLESDPQSRIATG
jgi:hypothetical protein